MKLRISLLTLLLLVTVIAVWLNYFVYARENSDLSRMLSSLRHMARELDVKDKELLHLVLRKPKGGKRSWHVHVPRGEQYQLLIFVAGYLPKEDKFPDTVTGCIDLTHGDKEIVLERGGKNIRILVDGDPRFSCENTMPGGAISEPVFIDQCVAFEEHEKAVLAKTSFESMITSSNGDKKLSGGIQVWIEKKNPTKHYEIEPPGKALLWPIRRQQPASQK